MADRREVAGPVVAVAARSQHQRHAIDDEGFDDPRDEPLAETHDVEVAVQIARERHERAPVVVPIAVEDAVERVLNGFLDRLRQQYDDNRREQRDDPGVPIRIIREYEAGQLQHRDVQSDARREEGRIR